MKTNWVVSCVFLVVAAASSNCLNSTCDSCNNTCVNGKCVVQISLSYCDCKYGWGGHFCDQSVTNMSGVSWSVIRWGLGIFSLCGLCVWASYLMILAIFTQQKQPVVAILVLVFCFCSAFVRVFYFALDPFGWKSVVAPCAIYSIDFVSLSCVGIAYMLMLIQWVGVVEHVEMNKNANLFVFLRVFCVFSVVVLGLVVAPASSIACLCNGTNCEEDYSDYVFFITWIILSGLALMFCIMLTSFIIVQLRRFPVKNSFNLIRFTVFVLCSSVSMLLLVVFTIILFVGEDISKLASETFFLATEGLKIGLVVLQLASMLLVITLRGHDNRQR